jgi:Spherulation-specific family 4
MTQVGYRKLLIAFTAAILISSFYVAISNSTRVNAASSASGPVGVVIPLYTYPTDGSWAAVASTKTSYPSVPIIAVINPNSGPGSSKDQNYVTGITNLENAGVTVIGYVATGYGTSSYSSLSNIEGQINDYKTWYPNIQGILFDEMSNSGSEASYYQSLENYVSSHGMQVTYGNPGTTVSTSLIGIFNNLCIYENPGLPSISDLNQYYSTYGKGGFSYIAYGISSLPSQSSLQSMDTYVSYIYITNLGGSNPYNGLPSYFKSEVAALASVDGSSSTTSHTSSTTVTTTTTTTSSATTVPITVETVGLSGQSITGIHVQILSSSGQVLDRGTAPITFNAIVGNTYTIRVLVHRGMIFEQWNTGSKSRAITVNISGPATYVATYNTS